MNARNPLAAAVIAVTLAVSAGCAVTRDQSSVGQYMDDAGITAQVKAKFVEDKTVAASAISVETLNGTVQLSGFAKSAEEKAAAERIAAGVKGVKSVKNSVVVSPAK